MNNEKSTKQKKAQPNKRTAESRENLNFSAKQGRSVGFCTTRAQRKQPLSGSLPLSLMFACLTP